MKTLISAVVLLISASPVMAQVYFVQSDNIDTDMSSYLKVLEQAEDAWTINDIIGEKAGLFLPASVTSYPNYGYVSHPVWTAFSLENRRNQPARVYLNIPSPRMRDLQIYLVKDNVVLSEKYAGVKKRFEERDIQHRSFNFELNVPASGSLDVYIRSFTERSHVLPVRLLSPGNLNSAVLIDTGKSGLFYGILLVVIILNFGMFFLYHDNTAFNYIAYETSILLLALTIDGYAFQFLWPVWPELNEGAARFLVPVVMMATVLGIGKIYNVDKTMPWARKFINLLVPILIIDMLLVVFFNSPIVLYALALTAVVLNIFCTTIVVKGVKLKLPNANYFALAWIALLTAALLWAGLISGVIPYYEAVSSLVRMSIIIQFVVLSVASVNSVVIQKKEQIQLVSRNLEVSRHLETLQMAAKNFLPSDILKLLEKDDIETLDLGDFIELEMSVLNIDIRSFTTITERMSSANNFSYLNNYLAKVAPVVADNNGFICRFIGDSVLAVFPYSADDAVKAGLEMLDAVAELNKELDNSIFPVVQVGIGIDTGQVIVGIVGDKDRMEISPLGEAVAKASELEQLTKLSGARLIISEQTLANLKMNQVFNYRKLTLPGAVGIESNSECFYEIFDADPVEVRRMKAETLDDFEMAIEEIRMGNHPKAANILNALLLENNEDKVVNKYLELIG